MKNNVFKKLGIADNPNILAPLAGVSDHPFRRLCQREGADLTYVEMISATALIYGNEKTRDMCKRHPDEKILGLQLTGRNSEEMGRATELLAGENYDTYDINMGCPVKKVVKTGAGSGILKDPQRVFDTVRAVKNATDKPVSAKIRLGWDHESVNYLEVADAIEKAGAEWMTIHGRTRADDYSTPVDLDGIRKLKQSISIPVIGNGNIFSAKDASHMRSVTGVDGVMVSRGALGNPWIFREINGDDTPVSREEWLITVLDHILWQHEAYGSRGIGPVCMRKHILWYVKGWPGAKALREQISLASCIESARNLVVEYAHQLMSKGFENRASVAPDDQSSRFSWDPKWEMDRKLDRGVGHIGLDGEVSD